MPEKHITFEKTDFITMEGCGEDGQVKLLGVAHSPFVVRVRIALALKGIHYEFIDEDIPNKSELLLQSNPVHKKFPVLIHNGKPICESMIIVQYIEEAWGSKAPFLMPKDPYDRSIARFWAAFVDDKLTQSIWGVFMGEGEKQVKAVEESVANLLLLEEALSGKAYFGDEIGLVDIALGGLLVGVQMIEKLTHTVLIGTQKMPLLSAWAHNFCMADGMGEVLPDPAKLFEFLSESRAKLISPPAGN